MKSFYERFGNFFNKEFSPFRSFVFTGCQISHLSSLIKALDYETYFHSENYRLGIRYFDSNNMKFNWKTTNKGKMLTKYWDKNDWKYNEYEKSMYFTDKMIHDNCLSHTLKNRKASFYYKLPESIKEDWDDYSNALINIYKMNNNIYGLSKKLWSNTIWFDIDNHNTEENNQAIIKLKKLLEKLEISLNDLFYIEGNYFTGGIHCVIKLPYKVGSKYYEILEKYLNDIGIEIECNFTNKVLRLPCSYEYLPLKRENLLEKNYFTINDYENNIVNVIENLSNKTVDSPLLNNILSIEQPSKYNELKSQLKLKNIRKLYKEKSNKWNGYWTNKRELFIKKESSKEISNIKDFYKLTNGNRFNTQKVLVPYMILRGLELNDVLNKLQELNIDSKDMKNFNKLIPEITTYYNKCKENIKVIPKGKYSKYISNTSSLNDITLKFLDNEDFQKYLTDKFVRYYIQTRKYKNNYISKEKYNILLKEIPYMIREIIGLIYYHINNLKQFKKESMNKYIGFQLSYNTLNLIQEQCIKDLNLEDSPLNRTSLQYLKKALLKVLDIEEINFNKRNWINGSCKSFKINSENDFRNMLIHLYNSCFKDIVNKKFILSNNKLYILYILLIENYDIIQYDEVEFIKNHIPILINTT